MFCIEKIYGTLLDAHVSHVTVDSERVIDGGLHWQLASAHQM